MVEPLTLLKKKLKDNGYSLTQTRQTVFTALHGREPMTMRELIASCGHVDRASVYRTTALFERLGIMQRLQIGWKYKLELCGAFAHHHHHLSCSRCGMTFVLPEDMILERRIHALAATHDFRPVEHQLEIRGFCSSCAAQHTEAAS